MDDLDDEEEDEGPLIYEDKDTDDEEGQGPDEAMETDEDADESEDEAADGVNEFEDLDDMSDWGKTPGNRKSFDLREAVWLLES